MKAHTLLAVVAIASLVSCNGLISPNTQAKIDQASAKYESATGISTGQTVSLLGKWYGDLQSTRDANKLLKTPPIPLGPVQATQASPVMDYTSAKAVLEGINQASAATSDDQSGGEGHAHPNRQTAETPAPRRDRSKPRVNEKSPPQMLATLGWHGPDRHPAAPGDQQSLSAKSQLPAPAIVIPIVHYRQSVRRPAFLDQLRGKHVPDAGHGHAPRLPTSAVGRVEVIGSDDLPAL